MTDNFFLFTEEQIKQRKQYEKAERQREMEICRQLVSLIGGSLFVFAKMLNIKKTS